MATATTPSTITVADLRTVLRRRVTVVLLGALLGIGLGFLVATNLEPPDPGATVGIEVVPTGVDLSQAGSRSTAALDIERAVIRITSDSVRTAAVEEFGSPLDAVTLEEQTSATQLGNAPLIEVLVTDEDPEAALAAADALAQAYLSVQEQAAVAAQSARIEALQRELDDTYAEVGALGTQIGSTEDLARIASLEGQRDGALRRATELARTLVEVRDENTDPGRIVQPARIVEESNLIGEVVAVPAAAALGLLLGIAGALLVDRLDRRVWDPEDVTVATGAAEVVLLPRTDMTGDGLRTGGGHRRVRALVAPTQMSAGTVLVTGASAEHGAGVAAGLATAIAASGRRTILVDASGADAFDLPGQAQLDEWLAGRTGLDRAARSPAGVSSLQVLTGSTDRELSSSSELRDLLGTRRAIVVVHAPGGSDSGDALSLAGIVDRIVVVAAARKDRDDVVARTHRWLARDAQTTPVVVLAG